MSNIINTAPCRFCGQMVQIETDEKLTKTTGRGRGYNVMHMCGGVRVSERETEER